MYINDLKLASKKQHSVVAGWHPVFAILSKYIQSSGARYCWPIWLPRLWCVWDVISASNKQQQQQPVVVVECRAVADSITSPPMRLPGMSPLTSRLPPIDISQLPDIGNIDIGPPSTLNIDISQLRWPHCRQWYRGRRGIIIVGRDNCRLCSLWNFPPPATNQPTRWSKSWASSDWKSHLARDGIW